MTDKTEKPAAQSNEGEGNKTAAREYNEAQHRFAESDDELRLLCERDKMRRRQHAEFRMAPARQSFDAQQPPAAGGNDRLIKRNEFVAHQPLFDLLFERQTFVRRWRVAASKTLEVVASVFFRSIHRAIGMP